MYNFNPIEASIMNLINKAKNILFVCIFALFAVTSVSAAEVYKIQSLTIQAIESGNIIELSDSSIWEVVPQITFDTKIPCITCYIQEHWSQGDLVEVRYRSGNYGAFTHDIKNNKDNSRAAVNTYIR